MDSSTITEIDREDLSGLIERIQHAIENDLSLSLEDMNLLLQAITTLCTLQSNIEKKDVTLHKLRKLLGMVQQSERKRSSRSSSSKKNKSNKERKPKKKPAPPAVEHHRMTHYQKGQICPCCSRGKLYKFDPAKLLRITGHAPFEAVQHITDRLRCNACQTLYTADLPASVLEDGDANQKYGYSARSLMAIDKFYSGLPYYHQSSLADIFSQSISASTVFDQCEQVANAATPVFYELKRQAANANGFLIDDTHNRILAQKPEMRGNPKGKGQKLRKGVYTSGMIAQCNDGHDIVLFETSLGHAGEHLHDILKKRSPNLPAPLLMCDALSHNTTTTYELHVAHCNAHARRYFYDLEALYPEDIEWLLQTYAGIWKNESFVKSQQMDDQKRLNYHEKYSLPIMQTIKDWALKKQSAKAFEQRSAFGKAIEYFLKYYKQLILFCRVKGVLVDNNRMEEKHKIVIRGRKTSHFYKTVIGAGVANILLSIIATCQQADENVYNYLLALQRNRESILENPKEWMPWNYRDKVAVLSQKNKPDK